MSALEINPGMYEQRDGRTVVVRQCSFDVAVSNMPWQCSLGFFRDNQGRAFPSSGEEHGTDLIRRVEDEPKAEEKCSPKFSHTGGFIEWPTFPVAGKVTWASTPKSLRVPDDDFHVSYGAREEIRRVDGNMYETQFCTAVKWCAQRNLKLISMGEWDGPPIYPPEKAELEAKIARLEAENESLSRQLRSRELNKEPASAGKAWRWSPMV